MQLAERLYIEGYVSYPRTEFPGFDFQETLRILPNWGTRFGGDARVRGERHTPQTREHARGLLDGGERLRARGGVDAGDHPPITPAAPAPESDVGGGDAWRLYDFIARRFVASVSSDCAYVRQRATLDVAGERFAVDGRSVTDAGWTSVMPWRGVEDDPLGPLTPGATVSTIPVSAVRLIPRQTAPPSHLTESELIGLMERHGIGTDASIPTHINNVEKRKYVEVRSGRKVVPTDLGLTLWRGYRAIDVELASPATRRGWRNSWIWSRPARRSTRRWWRTSCDSLRRSTPTSSAPWIAWTRCSRLKFDPGSGAARTFSKCGRCARYLTLVGARRKRLYCAAEEETFELPQGLVKLYNGRECGVCGFELLLSAQGDRVYPLCPYCHNHPPFPGGPTPGSVVGGCFIRPRNLWRLMFYTRPRRRSVAYRSRARTRARTRS